jgi:hypothetical protein
LNFKFLLNFHHEKFHHENYWIQLSLSVKLESSEKQGTKVVSSTSDLPDNVIHPRPAVLSTSEQATELAAPPEAGSSETDPSEADPEVYLEMLRSQADQLKAVEAKYESRIQEIVQRQQVIEQRMEELEAREVFMHRQLLELREKQTQLQERLEMLRQRNEFFRYNVTTPTYYMVNSQEMHIFFSRLLVGLWEEDESTLQSAIEFLDQLHRN